MSYVEVAKIEEIINLLSVNLGRRKKKFVLVLLPYSQNAKFKAMAHDKCLGKIERALHLWVEDWNRKCVPSDGQKTLSHTGFSRGGQILQVRTQEWVAIAFSRDLLDLVIETRSPVLKADSLPSEPPEKTLQVRDSYTDSGIGKDLD